jgi:hypothetical protein
VFRSTTGITLDLNKALQKSLEKSGEFAGLLEQLRASTLNEWNAQMADTRTSFTALFSTIQQTVQGWLASTEKDAQSALQKLADLNQVCQARA